MSFGFNCTETPTACEHHDSMLGTALVSAGCTLAIIIGGSIACWWKLRNVQTGGAEAHQPFVTDIDNTSQQTASSVRSCLCRCRRKKNPASTADP